MQQVSAAEGYRERCGMVFMEERISLVGRGSSLEAIGVVVETACYAKPPSKRSSTATTELWSILHKFAMRIE